MATSDTITIQFWDPGIGGGSCGELRIRNERISLVAEMSGDPRRSDMREIIPSDKLHKMYEAGKKSLNQTNESVLVGMAIVLREQLFKRTKLRLLDAHGNVLRSLD